MKEGSRTVIKQVKSLELSHESVNSRASPNGDSSAIGEDLGRGSRIKLPREVTVLLETTVTVVRPESVDRPTVLGQELSLPLKTSPG